MQILIIAIGRIKEKFLQDGIAEYEKRLRPYVNLQIRELAEEKRPVSASVSLEKAAMEKEGERILAAISPVLHHIPRCQRDQLVKYRAGRFHEAKGTERDEPDRVCHWRGSRSLPGGPVTERHATLALEDDVYPPDGPAPSP